MSGGTTGPLLLYPGVLQIYCSRVPGYYRSITPVSWGTTDLLLPCPGLLQVHYSCILGILQVHYYKCEHAHTIQRYPMNRRRKSSEANSPVSFCCTSLLADEGADRASALMQCRLNPCLIQATIIKTQEVTMHNRTITVNSKPVTLRTRTHARTHKANRL